MSIERVNVFCMCENKRLHLDVRVQETSVSVRMHVCRWTDGQMDGFVAFSISRATIAISDQTALFLVLILRCLEPDDGAFLNMRQARNGNFYSNKKTVLDILRHTW